MSLDLGKTLGQLQAAMGDVSETVRMRRRRFADRIVQGWNVSPDEARTRTESAGVTEFIVARTGVEGLLASIPPPAVPHDWSAVSVDGSHIDVDRHLPLSCYLINLGGCTIVYGDNPGCEFFSEPTLAVREAELYLAHDAGRTADTPIAGPLLGALRTVREVEGLADAVAAADDSMPVLAVLDGTLVFRDLQSGNYPGYVVQRLINERLEPALERLRLASERSGNVIVASYTSRPQTTEVVGALRVCLCGRDLVRCAEHCSLRRSDQDACDGAAGFDDRELFETVLEPGHRSPLYESGRRAPRSSFGYTWVHFYYVQAGDEIARVEVPHWVARNPYLLSMSHALIVRQCELGKGYPVVVSEAHEQAVITGRDRHEFRNVVLNELEKHGLPSIESAKTVSKRRPWV